MSASTSEHLRGLLLEQLEELERLRERNAKLERLAKVAKSYRIIARLPIPTTEGINMLRWMGADFDEALFALEDHEGRRM